MNIDPVTGLPSVHGADSVHLSAHQAGTYAVHHQGAHGHHLSSRRHSHLCDDATCTASVGPASPVIKAVFLLVLLAVVAAGGFIAYQVFTGFTDPAFGGDQAVCTQDGREITCPPLS